MQASVEDGWHQADTITSVMVHVSIVVLALAAAVRFFVLRQFSRRHKSELKCSHNVLPDGQIIFRAEYMVSNIGERPIDFTGVSLTLCAAKLQDGLFSPEPKVVLAKRVFDPNDPEVKALLHIEAGQRSIFTLTTKLTSLDEVSSLLCQLSWESGRRFVFWKDKPSPPPFKHLYIRRDLSEDRPQAPEAQKVASAGR